MVFEADSGFMGLESVCSQRINESPESLLQVSWVQNFGGLMESWDWAISTDFTRFGCGFSGNVVS